LAISRLKIKIF